MDIAAALGCGLIALIVHSRETTGGVLADVFCFDIADHQMGEVLNDLCNDDETFNFKYDLARKELRTIVNEQAALLEMYVMSCEFISNVFYNAYPNMVQILIQEGKEVVKDGTLASMQGILDAELQINNQLYVHAIPPDIEEDPCFKDIPF